MQRLPPIRLFSVFEAVIRTGSPQRAAAELNVSQPAISQAIKALETQIGANLLDRSTRPPTLTEAGRILQRAVSEGFSKITGAIDEIGSLNQTAQDSVTIACSAGTATYWLMPRLTEFYACFDNLSVNVMTTAQGTPSLGLGVDLAIRYGPASAMPGHAVRLFGEQLAPVISPWLLKSSPSIQKPEDLARFTLIEAGDAHRTHLEWLTWRRWFDEQHLAKVSPKRWLYFNYAYQMTQAALAGQGVVLARLPLVAENLAHGDLVEVLPHTRMNSPMAYWLITGPRSLPRAEIQAFCEWLKLQAAATRQTSGEVADP